MLSILHAGRSERTNVAAAGMVHLRTMWARSDPRRPRFQVLLPQLPKSEASGLNCCPQMIRFGPQWGHGDARESSREQRTPGKYPLLTRVVLGWLLRRGLSIARLPVLDTER